MWLRGASRLPSRRRTCRASRKAAAVTPHCALDHLGSIAATVNAASTSPVLRSYDGWGKQRFTSGADDTANRLWGQNAELRGFLGQEQVAANGLVNLNTRMYDPWLGRFLAVDPVIASIYRLKALNPYSYVENDPLTWGDPSGMCFFTCPFRAFYDAYKTVTKFGSRALGPAEILIIAIVAVVTFQYEVFPALAAEAGAVSTGAAVASGGAAAGAAVTEFADLSLGLQALDIGLSGAIGGAINTGTLRGSLVGAATAEAFWGVGLIKSNLGLAVQEGVTPSP